MRRFRQSCAALLVSWSPGPPNPRGESMSRIWVNLRTPSRDNPTTVSAPGSLLWVLLAAAAVLTIVFVSLAVAFHLLGG